MNLLKLALSLLTLDHLSELDDVMPDVAASAFTATELLEDPPPGG